MNKKHYNVRGYNIDREINEIIPLIRSSKTFDCDNISLMCFMDVRECVKPIFDKYENEINSEYIGILEWAFVQQIIEDGNKLESQGAKEDILAKFVGHPNIVMIE